jgi:hypothetical protein
MHDDSEEVEERGECRSADELMLNENRDATKIMGSSDGNQANWPRDSADERMHEELQVVRWCQIVLLLRWWAEMMMMR